MFYKLFKAPAIIRSGEGTLHRIDELLQSEHLSFPNKILVTQKELFEAYQEELSCTKFRDVILVTGGSVDEVESLASRIRDRDSLVLAFGGGSVLDLVKYTASRCDVPYITVPSALSNDAVYSCVARLTSEGKKKSFGVQPPIGIVVDFNIIRKSPRALLLAGVADIVSNLSALKDWKLAHDKMGEPINELAYMLSRESVMPLLNYSGRDVIFTKEFLYDLTNAIVTSGLAMIIAGNTRVSSGSEHLISHAIDEYYPERSTVHGLQVGWAHLIVERDYRRNDSDYAKLRSFYESIGLLDVITKMVNWREDEFSALIPLAMKVRNRFTVFNCCKK